MHKQPHIIDQFITANDTLFEILLLLVQPVPGALVGRAAMISYVRCGCERVMWDGRVAADL